MTEWAIKGIRNQIANKIPEFQHINMSLISFNDVKFYISLKGSNFPNAYEGLFNATNMNTHIKPRKRTLTNCL